MLCRDTSPGGTSGGGCFPCCPPHPLPRGHPGQGGGEGSLPPLLSCPCPPPRWEQAGGPRCQGKPWQHQGSFSPRGDRDLGDGEEDEGEEGATLGKMKTLGDRGKRWRVREEDVQRDLGVVESW